jgi:hypothetical protein
MKIAIVGAGWVGCHLAYKFKDSHNIKLYEKNSEIFLGSSLFNQNRLHLGFHYPRNSETRDLCKNTFENFLIDYKFLTKKIDKNIYCIPKLKSYLDFNTFLKIYSDYEIELSDTNLKNISGCINTKERFIDANKAKNFFEGVLNGLIIYEKINKTKLKKLSKNFDIVVDCTNNENEIIKKNVFYELTISLIYEKNNETDFDSLTLVDGKLFSLFPYKNNQYTLTDVEFTPIKKFKTFKEVHTHQKKITPKYIKKIRGLIEGKVFEYYPSFSKDFTYKDYFFSTKTKTDNLSDSRYPIIKKQGNVISCFTGKIQGIYIIEEFLKKIISQ